MLSVIDDHPGEAWSPQELSTQTGISLAVTMIIVARLTAAGLVHHDGLGTGYESITTRRQRLAG